MRAETLPTTPAPTPPPTPDHVGPRVRTVYVVTHPQATHHVDGLVGGWFDSELTPAGRRDAEAVGRELRSRIPTGAAVEVVSSDLRRTAQTAKALGEALGVLPVLDPRLRENSYGEAGGRRQAWLDERFVAPPAVGDRVRHHDGIDGSETRLTLVNRVYEGMAALLARDCSHQVVVTHGGAGTFVVAAWIGLPVESTGYVSFRMPPGSITVLREDELFHNRQVAVLGSVAHLVG